MPSEPDLPLLLTIPQVAHHLGCGRTRVYSLMDRGELEYVKDGNFRRIPRRALLAYVGRHSRKAKGRRDQGDAEDAG